MLRVKKGQLKVTRKEDESAFFVCIFLLVYGHYTNLTTVMATTCTLLFTLQGGVQVPAGGDGPVGGGGSTPTQERCRDWDRGNRDWKVRDWDGVNRERKVSDWGGAGATKREKKKRLQIDNRDWKFWEIGRWQQRLKDYILRWWQQRLKD